jgi:hypothetical protein
VLPRRPTGSTATARHRMRRYANGGWYLSAFSGSTLVGIALGRVVKQ